MLRNVIWQRDRSMTWRFHRRKKRISSKTRPRKTRFNPDLPKVRAFISSKRKGGCCYKEWRFERCLGFFFEVLLVFCWDQESVEWSFGKPKVIERRAKEEGKETLGERTLSTSELLHVRDACRSKKIVQGSRGKGFKARKEGRKAFVSQLDLPPPRPLLPSHLKSTHFSLLLPTSQLWTLAVLTSIVVIWSLKNSKSILKFSKLFLAPASFVSSRVIASSKG